MHRYEHSAPRLALGLAAAAMTALSIVVLVVAPASVEAGAHGAGLAKSTRATLASIKAASDTAVDLVALHEEEAELMAPCTLSGTPTQKGDSND